MRRIATGITALALVAQLVGCAADAPTAPKPGGGGGNNDGSLQISLFTNDANPAAGGCSLIQAVATLNGVNVPNGTGIVFSTDLGTFAQNGQGNVSVDTTAGQATTAVCSPRPGVATVKAKATVQGKAGSATLPVSFQPSNSAAVVTSCSPSFGSPNGGTSLTINGARFFGTPSSTKVTFTAAGVTRDGLVTGVSSTQISLVTPAFPEAQSLAVPVQMLITLGLGTGSPEVITSSNCFVFGSSPPGTPTVLSVLPSSGKNDGNTRVTIVGSGFAAPVQVFFGPAEATVLSVAYNQIVALSPPATGIGLPNQNATVDIRVHEVNSGQDGTLAAAFKYGPAMRIISFSGANVQSAAGPFTPLTINGEGFDAPVKVSLAGWVATVMSVSATEIVVLPGNIVASGCSDVSGPIEVTNIDTGETASGQTFTYLVAESAPIITGVAPAQGQVPASGIDLTISGVNFPNSIAGVSVSLGGRQVPVTAASVTSITVHIPETTTAPPTCNGATGGTLLPAGGAQDIVVTNVATTCSATFAGAFTYLLPCTP